MQVHEVIQHIGRGTVSEISPLRHPIWQMLEMRTSVQAPETAGRSREPEVVAEL